MYGHTTVPVQTRVLAAKTQLTAWHRAELHTVHKCHEPIKELHHFPSRIMGKPLQISKCQTHTNTFQLSHMQAAAGIRGEDVLCQVDHHHWGLRQRWTALRLRSQVKKKREERNFQNLGYWPGNKTEHRLPTTLCFCHLLMCAAVMTAGCLSSLLGQHTSLLSQQMIGHLCLTGATGLSGASLTGPLITPLGRGRSQSGAKRNTWINTVQWGGSRVWSLVRHRTAVVPLQTLKNLRKNTRISPKTQVLEVLRAVGAS